MRYAELERCYKTVLKQRDEAEVKVKLLTSLIEDDLWPGYAAKGRIIERKLEKIGV